jgi:hypothetical protein
MAEPDVRSLSCCDPAALESCCEPAQKDTCCGHGEGCDCAPGAVADADIRERRPAAGR